MKDTLKCPKIKFFDYRILSFCDLFGFFFVSLENIVSVVKKRLHVMR